MVTLINTHLFWEPGHSEERIRQVRKLIDWSGEHSDNLPVIICGDFNAPPDSHSIQLMKERYRSAYESVHHREPAYTYPTPLPMSPFHKLKTVIGFLPFIHLTVIRMDRHNVLDYIFVNHLIKVLDCNLVFDRSHPENEKIYASDHFGLFAEVSCIQ
jgi:endonuclease/exonuclease/phosphatase family metal-dependent hydrolase